MSTNNQWFDHKITTGNILQIATICVLGLGAWFKHDNRIFNSEQALIRTQMQIDKHELLLETLIRNTDKLTILVDDIQKRRMFPLKEENRTP